ncbi:MAG: hypothetical protein B6I20_13765 [Bacteroidetes bacterium 4572_117]|nr:MAG: hypothetical protein B6I20_13765 [Bacteroidetes bacterium 4572_117]
MYYDNTNSMTIPIEEQTNETVGEGEPDLKKQVEARIKQNSLDYPIDIQSNDKMNMDSEFVLKCLEDNMRGSAEIYKKLFRDKFIFNKSGGYWMKWDNHYWVEDELDVSTAVFVDVISIYKNEMLHQIEKLKKLTKEEKTNPQIKAIKKTIKNLNAVIWNLNNDFYPSHVLNLVHKTHQGLVIKGDELDKKPWLLPCNNGVINLKTGELNQGVPRDFLNKHCLIDYPDKGIDVSPVVWEKTLLEIFSQNQELVDFFQRLCGQCLVGEVIDHKFIVLNGRGRNGKSLIIETISSILGDFATSIQPDMLLAQHNSNGSAPNPGLMKLKGARFVFASETEAGKRIATAKIKLYTGNDTLVARNPFEKREVSFKPSHTLFLATNNIPGAPAEDFAFWERVLVIPFDVSFVDHEPNNENERMSNPDLPNQLKKEYPQILSWMVKGCLMWQKNGLGSSIIVKDAVEDYRRDEDQLQDFIEECCEEDELNFINATEIYTACNIWWKEKVSKYGLSQKRFGKMFKEKFDWKKTPNVTYYGVKLQEKLNIKEVTY